MSVPALNWAFAQNLQRSSEQFVLVCLANHANEENLAYPSVDRIRAETRLNRKTILACLTVLRQAGLIFDTGNRAGRTASVPAYRLAVPKTGQLPIEQSQKWDSLAVPKTGQLEGEAVPKTDGSSPVFGTAYIGNHHEPSTLPLTPSKAEEERARHFKSITKLKAFLAEKYGRPNHCIWDPAEESFISAIVRRPGYVEEVNTLMAYRDEVGRFFPRSILGLLERWGQKVDEARNPAARKEPRQ